MSHHHEATGTIWAVFGHRFALEGPGGRILADLGPEGAAGLTLTPGDTVTVAGERKPTEIKVHRLTLGDGSVHTVARPAKAESTPADPQAALGVARVAGYAPSGEPKRKPKHFEVPATRDGAAFTLHVTLDGHLRKAEPARAA
ncbi:hypothetical protein [Methylobacterium gossipiicola]|uniref:Uncharacterized protein n=1 Tax=Methylobacterium gossipiicola TaxID=582675 RepID=A0A1I2QNX7_9HYPH|nr:hypothetical protein [Methylobacterium gossipiicola]SFG30132.1 hypothetical protein SAMN05192565_101281 [Methylobacterium gossipiicola]